MARGGKVVLERQNVIRSFWGWTGDNITKPIGHSSGYRIHRGVWRVDADALLRQSEKCPLLGVIECEGLQSTKYDRIFLRVQ